MLEIWKWTRTTKAGWMQKKTNEAVLTEIGEQRRPIEFKERKLNFFDT